MFNAHVIEDFISKEDCEYLVKTAILSNLWESGGSEFWDNRVINYDKMRQFDRNATVIMLDANIRCGQKLKELYDLEEVYSDTLQIIRWFPGMSQPPHADDMSNTDIEGFDHRAFGSIIYLNDAYEGGHTYYPNFDYEVTPKAGALAVHPGDPEHLHGVTEIKDGMRYTIASFWTKQKGLGHEWKIY
jgi:prolyl 4-hydroxylase